MVKLVLPEVKEEPDTAISCPACGSKESIVHQTLSKEIKDSIIKRVTIKRMKCKSCHYTFRVYPAGVREYSSRSKRLVFLGTILYLAGLSYERCEWFLAGLLGREFMDMVTIWRDMQEIGRKSRKRGFPKGISLVIGLDGAYFKVRGEKVATMFASEANNGITIWFDVRDERDKAAIKKTINELSQLYQIEGVITDDWELYKEPLDEKKIPHQVCLAHVKRNLKRRLSEIKEGALDIKERLIKLIESPRWCWEELGEIAQDERLWLKENVKLRRIIAQMIRNWDYYTAYLKKPSLPITNNVTERSILLSKVRYKTTRGLKSISGLGNFIGATQLFGRQEFDEIAALIS